MSHGGDRYRNEVKLDFSININPDGISKGVLMSLVNSINEVENYPDPKNQLLTEKLCAVVKLEKGNIVFGNGASEVLMAAVHAFRPKKVLLPVPSFTGYEHLITAAEADVVNYYLSESDGFELKREFLDEIDSSYDMLFLTNPNNPTGLYIDHELLKDILDKCRENNVKAILDECFMVLSDEPENNSCIGEMDRWPNLMILRAFTKSFAIPGLRLGYMLCGDKETVSKIKAHIPEWNISVYAHNAGVAALDDYDKLAETRIRLANERSYLIDELENLGFKTIGSRANYILFKDSRCRKINFYEELLNVGILIRDCSDYNGLAEGFLRIAVRPHEENTELIKAMKSILR